MRCRFFDVGWCALLMLAVGAMPVAQADAGPADMRARVSALGYLPLMSIGVSTSTYESLLHGKRRPPKAVVVSRVYDLQRHGARELGVIIARRVSLAPNEFGIELVCRLHGEAERPRWLLIDSRREGTPAEGSVDALAMEFRGNREPGWYAEWAKLPPVACGQPVWWPMAGTELHGNRAAAPAGLYQLSAAVHGEIAYTGTAVTLRPKGIYRILRIHDGVIDLRRASDWDTEGAPDVLPVERRTPIAVGQLPPTIRIKVRDVVDADGRVRMVTAYLGD